jgi:hypothetical protein
VTTLMRRMMTGVLNKKRPVPYGPELVTGIPPAGWASPGWSPTTFAGVDQSGPWGTGKALEITIASAGGNGGVYASPALEAGKTYRVSVWVKPITVAAFTLTMYTAAWAEIKTIYSTGGMTDWENLLTTFVSPGAGGQMMLYATGANGNKGLAACASIQEVLNP